MPDSNSLITVLTEYSGSIIETQTAGIQLKQPSLQVRVRGAKEDYTTPRTRIEAIKREMGDKYLLAPLYTKLRKPLK
jgi:hypothetical protein